MNLVPTHIVRFILLVAFQSLIFSFLPLFNYALGFVFIFFILFLPLKWPKYTQLLLAFLIGLSVDFLTATHGIHTILSPIVVMLREPILRALLPKYNHEEWLNLNLLNRGITDFSAYSLVMSLIYCVGFYSLNFFTFSAIIQILIYSLSSTVFTFILLLLYRYIIANPNQTEV